MSESTSQDDKSNNVKEEENKSICSQLINFQSILTEQYNKDINQITSIINFFEKMSSIYNNLNISANEIYPNENTDNYTMDNILSSFYNFHKQIFDIFKDLPEKINQEILIPLKKTKKIFEKENKKTIMSIKDVIEQLSLHQDVLNIIKKEYNEENQKLELIEKNNNKDNSNNNQIMQRMSTQTKLIENKISLYKKEVEVMKKLYSDCQKDFRNLKLKIQENDIKKNTSIYGIVNSYIKIFLNNIKKIDKENVSFDSKLNQFKTSINNTQSIDDLYNNIPELNINWNYDFDISSGNNDSNNNDNNENKIENKMDNNEENSKEKEIGKNPVKYEEMLIMPTNNYEIKGIDINYMELNKKFYEKIKPELDEETEKFSNDLSSIPDFFKIICSKNIIQSDQKNKIMNILEKYQGNINCYIKFCEAFLDSNDSELKNIFEFKSFSNFAYFSNLLKNIIENISEKLLSNDIKTYILFDKIICIGEKSLYEDTYMCGLLSSENQIFKKDIIWKNSIKNKLINLFEDICKKEYNSQNINDSGYIRKGFNAFGKFFQRRESVKKKHNIIELYAFDKYIKIYRQLNEETIKYITKNYGPIILHEVIKCYIRHMINYNFLSSNNISIQGEEIIKMILDDFSINDNNNIKFFNLYLLSNIYSVKKPVLNGKEKLKKNILLKINNYENDKSNIFIIKKSSKYLNNKEIINLINLSKKYININKYIYHRILRKNDDFNSNKRIGIWKIILKYNDSVKKIDYKKLLSEVNKIPINEKEGSDFVIMVDIKRTKFKGKNSEGHKVLCNLLRCLFYRNEIDNNNDNNNEIIDDKDKYNYCQGMNFITALFYDIIQNEEETFHLLKSFFIHGKYEIIFKNKLSKLKDYFTILEKLIYLYLPKIHHKLITNQIQVNFFSSPYFVTLFTNIYYFHPDNANKFLLHSLDDFILEGWCSVFSTAICVLKYFEKKILDLNGEELIKFIVNDIGKSDLFIDDNYLTFYTLKKQFWINNELLECLEEEIKIENEIKSEYDQNNNSTV